jgi:hypothetical protein
MTPTFETQERHSQDGKRPGTLLSKNRHVLGFVFPANRHDLWVTTDDENPLVLWAKVPPLEKGGQGGFSGGALRISFPGQEPGNEKETPIKIRCRYWGRQTATIP